MENLEYIVGGGTLLGLVRGGSPIEGDDDVDFYVNKKNRQDILKILEKAQVSINFEAWPNSTDHFLQILCPINGIEVRVDFYFYDAETDKNYLLEYWNYRGAVHDSTTVLRTPKVFYYPIQNQEFHGFVVKLPNLHFELLEFLYGVNWRQPVSKNKYLTIVRSGRPIFCKRENGEIMHV